MSNWPLLEVIGVCAMVTGVGLLAAIAMHLKTLCNIFEKKAKDD